MPYALPNDVAIIIVLLRIKCNRSKLQLHAELNISRATGACNLAGFGRSYCVTRRVEIWVIEKVESFRAKFQIQAFADLSSFDQRDVPLLKSGSREDIAPRVSKSRPTLGQCLRQRVR